MDGIPVVLMESISYNLPLISTNISGIPEICINNHKGFLVSEKNAKEIVESIVKIFGNDNLRNMFSVNSRKLIAKYDIDNNSFLKLNKLNWYS